jgi:uncharacterized protein (TIGR03083 family)
MGDEDRLERYIAGIDAFGILDAEAARIDQYFATLRASMWAWPSRCEGWTVRDVLAHLTASEDYNRACLAGSVPDYLDAMQAKGMVDLDSLNAIGVAELDGVDGPELLVRWRAANGATRQALRARGRGSVDTSVGPYPARWQALHLASELATHADDVGVPVRSGERDERRAWRAAFSRFALAETKPELEIVDDHARTAIHGDGIEVALDDDELIEAVADRAGDSSTLDPQAREVLSMMS